MKKFLGTLMGAVALSSQVFAEGAAPAKSGSYIQTLVMIAVFLLIFYFILWRPEQKRRKRMETQRNSIKTGDKVTAMGIVGTVAEVKDNTIILSMVDGSKIEFMKAAITEVNAPQVAPKKA